MNLSPCLVTAASIQGSRPTFEDRIDVSARVVNDNPYIYCGVFDGHGGSEASELARNHLLTCIEHQKGFMSRNQLLFFNAIRNGFKRIHEEMKILSKKWKKQSEGDLYPCDGTTASVVFVAHNKVYIAYVGDSPIYVIYKKSDGSRLFKKIGPLHDSYNYRDHQSIYKAGGNVFMEENKGCFVQSKVKTTTKPRCLRMTRSLGDFWLCNDEDDTILSCEPTIFVSELNDIENIIITSDGISFPDNRDLVRHVVLAGYKNINPAHHLINQFLHIATPYMKEFDNISVICMSFLPQKGSTLTGEFQCSTKGIENARGVNFNQALTFNPLGGIYFKDDRTFLKTMNKPIITGPSSLKDCQRINEPGYVVPLFSEIDEDKENKPPANNSNSKIKPKDFIITEKEFLQIASEYR